MRAKNYENWLAVDNVMAKIMRLTFLAHPVEVYDFDHLIYVIVLGYFIGTNERLAPCLGSNRPNLTFGCKSTSIPPPLLYS